MKIIISLFLLLAFGVAEACNLGYRTCISQRNAANTNTSAINITNPGSDAVYFFEQGTLTPRLATLGANCSITSGVLNCSGSGVNADWNAVSGAAEILNKPSTFPPSWHAHVSSDITNFNSAADARVVAGITGKENTILSGLTGQYFRWDKTFSAIPKGDVGLGNVDNTSDINKPISTATQTALNGKFNNPSGSAASCIKGDGSISACTASRSFNYTTRSLNTCFQVSSTRDAFVSYSVDILTSLSLTAGQQGTVYLRTYTDSSCTTGTQEIVRFVNGQTGTLTIGLALSQNVTATLTGIIPAGSYIQLVTQNNTGTPTFTARPGQEVLL